MARVLFTQNLQRHVKCLECDVEARTVREAHPEDPDTAWFVPGVKDECRVPVDGKVVVARTRDGGQSFTVLRSGLPQENAYDLVYRHALDVDPTGQALTFGSTTGSVWWSGDQGDTWRHVSAHLPPVYCVRFG